MAVVISTSKLIELLRSADGHENLYVRVLSASRLGLGKGPDSPTLVIDLSKEKIGPLSRAEPDPIGIPSANGPQAPLANGGGSRMPRRSGNYWFEIRGRRANCRSLKEVLSGSLQALEKTAPGTIEKLSKVRARSRRIVARDRNDLYRRQDLNERYAESLVAGWWYGTNNSAEQTGVWLKRACGFASLRWGDDFKVSFATPIDLMDL